jgi:hypothetical protein
MKSVAFVCFILLLSGKSWSQMTYYVDGKKGNDHHSGLSSTQAWATLEKVNQVIFKPGDRILFRSGTVYQGQFKPQGSGSEGSPILVDQYGRGSKPRIDGQGKTTAAVLLYNVEFWEISNLEITNTGETRQPRRTGVTIMAENFGDCRHLYLRDLSIHDVNGSLVKKEGGGSAIFWRNTGQASLTRFVDLRIEGCHLYRCERNGITSSGYIRRDQWRPSVGVIIRKNLLEQIPGDGIVPIGCDSAVIEYNTMRDSPDILSHEEAAAGIWPWSCDNTIIQYNEVSGHKAKWDGQGFDADWNCKNTIIQYNYSHDNAGGFLLICNNGENIHSNINAGTTGTIVRYNVSVNDGLRPYPTERAGYFSPVFHITGPCKDSRIYNNIIFVKRKASAQIDRSIIRMENWGGPWPENTLFTNNIFYSLDSAQFVFGKDIHTVFSNNVFFGLFKNLPEDAFALFKDPLFQSVDPGASGLKSLEGFRLKANSPCINTGSNVDPKAIHDFFGNAVDPSTNVVDRGIHETSGNK